MSLVQESKSDTSAQQAAEHFRANCEALAISLAAPDGQWLPARDGQLTAKRAGQWVAGCSVPRRAAQQMLRALQIKGSMTCLLCPTHAGQIVALIERIDPTQGIIVLLPDDSEWSTILSCADFSAMIRDRRLFFCVGPDWNEQLDALYAAQPGLPLPAQFVRLPITAGEICNPIIQTAQATFSRIGERVGKQILECRSLRSTSRRLCIVAPSRFRLWHNAGDVLRSLDMDGQSILIDTDTPIQSAPLAIAQAATSASGILTANLGRASLPEIVHSDTPWITWATEQTVPAFVPTSPNDQLILADASAKTSALEAGWPADRISIAGWPDAKSIGSPKQPCIGLFMDLSDLKPPKQVEDFSSLRLIWENIAADLQADPFRLDETPQTLVRRYQRRLELPDDQLPMDLFVESLVLPAHAIGLARALVAQQYPFKLFGRGWDAIESLRPHCCGPIDSTSYLNDALAQCTVVIDPFHAGAAHPVHHAGKIAVSSRRKTATQFWQNLRSALANPAPAPSAVAPITLAKVRELAGLS